MKSIDEYWLNKVEYKDMHGIIKPSYSRWTICYGLSLEGSINSIIKISEYLLQIFYFKELKNL